MPDTVVSLLDQLEPMAKLSASRRRELAALCFVEQVNKDIDPLRMNVNKSAQALYLLKGDLGIRYYDNSKAIVRGGTRLTKHPVNANPKIKDSLALTDVEILRIDIDLLDIMMTWDQLSVTDNSVQHSESKPSVQSHEMQLPLSSIRSTGDWMNDTSIFSAFNLQKGVFSRLPAANIEEMFKRMTRINVMAGQVIIQQGNEGDYYYLIDKGSVVVSRVVDGSRPAVVVAELHSGSAFGEEALVSDNKRNATVTMLTDGELLRLNKKDFVELLKAPLITQISMADAQAKVLSGAIWADVRLPSEYQFDHIAGAINLPLNEIRTLAGKLDSSKDYIVYCQTGRRSSAAAFILAQYGFHVLVLAGGTRQMSL
ncbi:thiosulfate sulfurtransferase PspE precursor [mine drainage metagenome]|uniref:Thiosulfate sulfurtransferase PspE n=1 Tax=mine drainage metagenome TaxID=410659 RepID=A0A1J5S900_9ZZZZ